MPSRHSGCPHYVTYHLGCIFLFTSALPFLVYTTHTRLFQLYRTEVFFVVLLLLLTLLLFPPSSSPSPSPYSPSPPPPPPPSFPFSRAHQHVRHPFSLSRGKLGCPVCHLVSPPFVKRQGEIRFSGFTNRGQESGEETTDRGRLV